MGALRTVTSGGAGNFAPVQVSGAVPGRTRAPIEKIASSTGLSAPKKVRPSFLKP